MYKNPVLKRELVSENRSFRFALIFVLFACLLMLVALVGLYIFIFKAEQTGCIDYRKMIHLYILTASIAFILIMAYIPLPAGLSLSGEREAEQLDLLLITAMSSRQIIFGKLKAILSTALLLLLMSLPVLCLVFLYGGIQTGDILLFLTVSAVECIYEASMGIFISSLCTKGCFAVFFHYCWLIIVNMLGIVFLFSPYFGIIPPQNALPLYLYYPLLLTPAASFYELIAAQGGAPDAVFHAINSQGIYEPTWVTDNWLLLSLLLQLAVSLMALYLSADRLKPESRNVYPLCNC